MIRITIAAALALVLMSCDTSRDVSSETLDSVGSRVERKLEEKITGAVSRLKEEGREAQVAAVLGRMRGLDGITVKMNDSSSVTLRGNVASEQDRSRALDIVAGIKGIATVIDSLSVGGMAAGSDSLSSRDSGTLVR